MPDAEAALARGFVLGQDDRIDPAHRGRVQALRPRAPARGQRPERRAARPSRDPAPRRARPLAAREARLHPGPDRGLRAGDRRGPVDPARRGDGRRGDRRGPRRHPALALVRARARGARDARRQPARERRRRLAAQLRGGRRDPAVGGAAPRCAARAAQWRRRNRRALAASPRARRGRRADDRGDARDGAADGAPLRVALARGAAGEPARAARRRPGHVARDAGGDGRAGARDPRRAPQRRRLAADRLHRVGRARARVARLGAGRSAPVDGGNVRRLCGPARIRTARHARRGAARRARDPRRARRSRCRAPRRRCSPPSPAAGGSPASSQRAADLEVSVLDVGQGDAILFEPAGHDAVLVDGGPPGAGLPEMLRAEGVERLGLVVLSHDSLDHAAGVRDALASMPVGALAYATAGPETLAAARAAGARPIGVAAGQGHARRPPEAGGPLAAARARRLAASPRRRRAQHPRRRRARALAGVLDAAHRRRRGGGGSRCGPARSTSSRSPTTAAPTRAWASCSTAASPGWP